MLLAAFISPAHTEITDSLHQSGVGPRQRCPPPGEVRPAFALDGSDLEDFLLHDPELPWFHYYMTISGDDPKPAEHPTSTPAQPPLGPPARPRVVNVAATLIILGAVTPFVATVIRAQWEATVGPDYAEQLANLIMISLIYCGLAMVVLGGRNWARITVTVLTVLVSFGLLSVLVQAMLAAARGLLSGGELFRAFLLAAALVAVVAGVVLLYIPAANAYFAQSRAYRAMRN